VCDGANFLGFFLLYVTVFFYDLTAEGAEGTEEEKREDRNE
jgi:hypothetical protein